MALHQVTRDIPVYILTSESTHSPIAAYLIQHSNFGLGHVMLVKQRQLPARLPDGRFVLSEKWKVMAAPNGNGAVFQELRDSGALDDMKRLGVKYVDIHPIANALARPADPFFVGALIHSGGDAAIKVLQKTPKEQIGTICRRGGRTVVVEYSEIPPGEEEAFPLGNAGLQLYTVDIIERAAGEELPYHIAKKKEKVIDDDGEQVVGDVHKFERFVFDALEFCQKVVLVRCIREDEFAPIKNANGAPADSPETARDLMMALHRRWAEAAGIQISDGGPLEFSPETTYGGEQLDSFLGQIVDPPAVL
jgi:UDP-N-acetylglucosamine pyrophosphorylase